MTDFKSVEILVSAIQELSFANSIENVMQIVRKSARKLTNADGVTFILKDDGFCFYADEEAISPLWKGKRFPIDSCISGWVMNNKQSAIIEDIFKDDRIPISLYKPTFVKSMAMVPIRQSNPIGAIGLYWASKHFATNEQLKLIQIIADSTSIAIENVNSYNKLEKTIKELAHQIEDKENQAIELINEKIQLEETQLLLNETGKIAKVGGWKIDLKTLQLTCSKEINNILEVPEDTVFTIDEAINLYALTSKDVIKQAVERILKFGEPIDLDLTFITAKGNIIQGKVLGKIQYDEKKIPKFVFGTFQDITNQKKVEQSLFRKSEELKKAQEIAQIGSFHIDLQTNIFTWSEQLYKMFGFESSSPPPLLNDSQKLFTEESWKLLENSLANAIETGGSYEIELKTIRKDGSNGWMWANGEAEKNKDGKVIAIRGVVQDITESKNAQIELINARQKAEFFLERYKIIFSQAPIGIALINSISGFIYEANHKYAQIVGRTNEQMQNLDWISITHPDDLQADLDNMKLLIENKIDGFKMQKRLLKPNNECVWIIMTIVPIFTEKHERKQHLALIEDITERRLYELNLKNAKDKAEEKEEKIKAQSLEILLNNERLESLLRVSQYPSNSIQELFDYALNEAVRLTKSKVGFIQSYNEEKKQLVLNSWSKDVMKECKITNQLFVYDLDKVGCWGETVRQRIPIIINDYQAENNFKKGLPVGHLKIEKFLAIPVIFDNKIVAVAAVANKTTDYTNSDIYQLTLLMDNVWKISERLILIKDLKLAKEQAEESSRLKTAFLQNMSHEIRTPLNAISGFSALLNKPELSLEKRNSFIQIIQSSSIQLVSIVSDILTISSLETKQEKINITKVCINNLIIELLTIFKQQALSQNISLYAKQQLNDSQSEIYTDNTKVTQILSNLLSNALKFTHEGLVEFGYNLKENELEFYVKDSGIGIKPELHEKIFERFGQVDRSTNKLYGGTGLGLTISKAFVELLGGKIWLQSEVGQGSTFYFTLPYKPVNEIYKNISNSKKSESYKTILVAEDEEFNFLLIEELLIDNEFKLIHAKDGKETVEIFKSNPNISLILMDIKMPRMTGNEAAKIIKEIKPELPIIAQSAYGLDHEIAKFKEIFDDYITKPILVAELKHKVAKYLNVSF